ncbi:hypothetical protein R1flu_003645 [Riccia fluitans]|uniref:(6-4)DNA photolyase n=1 Tax=Riccia fluitans TaxID=41844 RepID=A0ABD1Y9Q8_9MARC
MAGGAKVEKRSIMWFRKGLRLHDNPALHKSCQDASHVFPLFVLDPFFLAPDPTAPSPGSRTVGVNRIQFLLESLRDLNASLESRGSKLLLVQGNPVEVLPELIEKWSINRLCFEFDTEPYAQDRDQQIKEICDHRGVEVHTPVSHTLFDPREVIAKNGGKPPLTYQAFCRKLGNPPKPLDDATVKVPAPPGDLKDVKVVPVPSLEDLGYVDLKEDFTPFRGGETEGLKRLEESLANKKWVSEFEKPKGDPTAFLKPATTCLSPYFKFGCVSARLFYSRLLAVYAESKKHTQPPVSLEGQMLWREFFYTAGYGTPNFDRMVGNPICKQIPWKDDENLLSCWRDGRTGYPWIDAAMIQLRKWGWLHHLARHAVACFLTRGDLFVYWEKGRDVFDRLLVDSDWALNNGNWMWLSASAFFAQYHRIYSPITFAKKYDPDGKYIKHFIPALKDMPKAYIYEPWTAPLSVQKQANCIIGKDYPKPVVDHAIANKKCRDRMGAAYALNKQAAPGQPTQEQVNTLNNKLTANLEGEADEQDVAAATDSGEDSSPSLKPKVKRQRKLPFQKKGGPAATESGEENSPPSPKPKVTRQRKLPFQKKG